WARFTALALLLGMAAVVLAWTTPPADLAPALGRLSRPLRWLRLPADELVMTVALSVRCVPLLFDEVRVLHAARRVRETEEPTGWGVRARRAHDLLVTALVSSVRRAGELADAMEARGGVGRPPADHT